MTTPTTPAEVLTDDFDQWLKNPYTKVLMKSIETDFVPRVDTEAAVLAKVAVPAGYVLVPTEPTPAILAAASTAVWPVASAADIEMARQAAPLILMTAEIGPGYTVESLAAVIATMAPAYRAMVAASPALSIDSAAKGPMP